MAAVILWAWRGSNTPVWRTDPEGNVHVIESGQRPVTRKNGEYVHMTIEDMDNCDNCIRTYWWWISYTNEQLNLGCALVAGTDSNAALINARRLGVAPAMSDVKMNRLTQDYSSRLYINKLITSKEALELVKTVA